MAKLVLLFLTLSGLHAASIAAPTGLHKSFLTNQLPDGFQRSVEHSVDISESALERLRQGAEPSRILVDIRTGLVKEHDSDVHRRAPSNSGFGEMDRRHWLIDEVSVDVPAQRNGDGGWVRVEEPPPPQLPDGFRQGTEPMMSIPDGFRQGTEPFRPIPDGFRQGTEPFMPIPDGFRQGTEPFRPIPDGFRQGTEPFRPIPDGFRQGTKPFMPIPDGFRQGTEPMMSIPNGFKQGTEPLMSNPDGFRQGTEPFMPIPDGFRQGTEPFMSVPDGFRQGTEPFMSSPDGFRQGTEPVMSNPDGFRQGTEPFVSLPDGFRQGTEPMMSNPDGYRQGTEPFISIPDGFRQGTEPSLNIPDGFRQGTEPFISIPDGYTQGTEPILKIPQGFRQGTEPSTPRIHTQTVACLGEVINGNCYEFNPTPMAFQDAQALCRARGSNAELASVTSGDLQSRLVSLVTKGGESNPVLTWLGATVKNQQGSWVDGSEWRYSDWMPGHPNIHTDKPVCVEMFRIDQSWWTAADCEQERASICSYPIAA